MSFGRSFIRGKRWAFRSTAAACERCVFGTGDHAATCPSRAIPDSSRPESQGLYPAPPQTVVEREAKYADEVERVLRQNLELYPSLKG
jgi:hypothetical protein